MVSRMLSVDARYPITWDTMLDEEERLATELCKKFADLRPHCADLLKAGDARTKAYHDRTTPLIDHTFVEGD